MAAPDPRKLSRDAQGLFTLGLTLVALVISLGVLLLPGLLRVVRVARASPTTAPREATCLVFGRRLSRGAPDFLFRARLDRAAALMRANPARHLVLLGGATTPGARTEAQAGLDYLYALSAPFDRPPLLEQGSRNTLENLCHAREILRAKGAQGLVLVSNRFHLARCGLIADSLGLEHRTCAAEIQKTAGPRMKGRYVTEAFFVTWFITGRTWARITGNDKMLARVS